MIAADLENVDAGSRYIKWPKLLQSEIVFTRDSILVWDWESSLENKALIQTNIWESERSKIEFHLEKATRTWNVSLILGDLEDYQKAEEGLREAIEGYKIAFGEDRPHTTTKPIRSNTAIVGLRKRVRHSSKATAWERWGGSRLKWQSIRPNPRVEIDIKDNYGQTPLSWAATNGNEAVVKLLLETGKVEVDSQDKTGGRTPLLWAAINGHVAVVKLLFETAVVKLLLETGKVEVDLKTDKAVVKLLIETGKVEQTFLFIDDSSDYSD
ncbi:hypothetical protein V8E54_013350 [Elaphomyces granulatus]